MLKYCNKCGFETQRNNEEEENNCPYHQEVMYDDEGGSYLKYEEFNQDGEEW